MEFSTNQNTVYWTAKEQGATDVFAKIVVAQAVHESGNFTSNLFKNDNNAFGFKMPSKRKSPYILGSGINAPKSEGATPYARYANLSDSVRDLFHWLNYNRINFSNIVTPSQYAIELKAKGYYGDTLANYSNALNRYFARFTDIVVKNPLLGTILFIVISASVLYFLTRK